MDNEIWVKSFLSDNYEVSNLGRIRSLGFDYIDKSGRRCVANPRIIKTCLNKKNGYIYAVLRVDKKPKGSAIHRLVAIAFHDNPENKKEVNHKDGNKLNNRSDNLEWCTKSENHKHRFEVLNQAPNCKGIFNRHGSKKVNQLTIDSIYIKTYPSLNEAARQLGINRTGISQALSGKFKTAGGYKWEFTQN